MITYHINLEIFWTILPAAILVLIIIPSFILLYNSEIYNRPFHSIKIIGSQWYWTYESDYNFLKNKITKYDSILISDEKLKSGQLRLLECDKPLFIPLQKHIRLLITSSDVLHSWAVPSLGIKVDATPGRLNQVSLFISRKGVFYGQCSEICGIYHSSMPICVVSHKIINNI